MIVPDKSQQNALLSWYKEGNPLRLELRHPLIKLAGEAGEILDLYGKHEYKPSFNWLEKCECKHNKSSHDYLGCLEKQCDCKFFYSIILSELGDYSYYLRIITWQQGVSFEAPCQDFKSDTATLEQLLNDLAYYSAILHRKWLKFNTINKGELQLLTFIFLSILEYLEIDLQTVLDLNYKKLNSEETQHGWSQAR